MRWFTDGSLDPLQAGAWFYAWVFAWSGGTKLADPKRAAWALVDFGVARRLSVARGLALGVCEVLLGVWLATQWGVAGALGVATVLLLVFAVLIGRSLRQEASFSCACFGGSEPLSAKTLARTATMAAGSVFFAGMGATRAHAVADGWQVRLEHGALALALLGSVVLAAQVPRLLRWNSDPFRIGAVVE